jgi:hypothetical protein
MLANLTSKNQLTLPKAIVNSVGNAEYYDANAVRDKLENLHITEQDIGNAITWARS